MSFAYEKDFYGWALEQAALIRTGQIENIDLENIAEEIEGMGKSQKKELISRLEILLMHLLKWKHQPQRRSNSWKLTIDNQRDKIIDHLADNPSLKYSMDEAITTAYRYARRDAANEIGIELMVFPSDYPWDKESILDQEFWPEVQEFKGTALY